MMYALSQFLAAKFVINTSGVSGAQMEVHIFLFKHRDPDDDGSALLSKLRTYSTD